MAPTTAKTMSGHRNKSRSLESKGKILRSPPAGGALNTMVVSNADIEIRLS
ncbi:MAG: hypothetical protein IIC26_08595 [Chloroflexi bacterium]|nr:hypothetical protein [Chloroflexota bacterium]